MNESQEKDLLGIIVAHLEVTERLLASYAKLYPVLLQQNQIASQMPAFQQPPTLRDMHASTQKLISQARKILSPK